MEKIKAYFKRVFYSYRSLPDKKQYVEFFTAILTVPVLLTVIVLNLNNLKNSNKTATAPTPTQERPIVVTLPDSKDDDKSRREPTPEPSKEACKKGIGPISIDYPEENSTIDDNPIIVDINYEEGDYCAVVWAYRINDSRFSDYDDKSIALYNVPNGVVRFQLRVKSILGGEEKVLTRTFTYKGASINITPTASGSAN